MFKNVASTFLVFAFDATTNVPKTGDAANITAYVAIDAGAVTVLGDTSATEFDATSAPGYYWFTAAQAETNGDRLMVTGKSSTSNIKVLGAPAVIYTRPTTGWLAPTTAARTLTVDASGRALSDIDTIKTNPVVNGGTITFPTNATVASTTNITAGTIATVTTVTNQLTAAAIATGVWQDATAGDFTTASSIGKSLYTSGVVPGATNGLFIAGTNAATVITTSLTTHFVGTVDTVTTYTGNTVQTGDAYARLGAPAGASIAADLAEIEGETDTLLAGVNVTQLNGDATSAANIAKTTRAIARGTASGVPTTTSIPTSAFTPAGAAADQFKGRIVTFDADTTTTALRGQATDITASSNAATPVLTVTALTTSPVSGDTFSVT